MNMKLLNKQHSELGIISSNFVALLVEDSLLNNISEIESLLTSLGDVLTAHLHTEDTLLYPVLAKSNNKNICATSKMFLASIGGLKKSFTEYINNWPKQKIVRSPTVFIKESNEIILALYDRITKEENQLFPLVDEESKNVWAYKKLNRLIFPVYLAFGFTLLPSPKYPSPY